MQVGRARRNLEDASTPPKKAPTRVIAPEGAPEAPLDMQQLSNGFRHLVEQAKLDRAWAAQIEQVLQQHFDEVPTLKDLAAGTASTLASVDAARVRDSDSLRTQIEGLTSEVKTNDAFVRTRLSRCR